MMRFTRKPQEVEAVQWNGWYSAELDVKPYIHRNPSWTCPKCGGIDLAHGWVDTFDGGHVVCPGDYIVRDVCDNSEDLASYSAEQFKQIFDPVEIMKADIS